MIQLERIERRFGAQQVFADLSWRIPVDGRIGLVGPNGAGKTSLLRILAGLEPPDAGRVHRPKGLRVGYLAQEVEGLEGSRSVLATVVEGDEEVRRLAGELEELEGALARLEVGDPEFDRLSELYGEARERFERLDGDRLEARARSILSGLRVPRDAFDGPLTRLSGGWRMRVALARMLVGRPNLLLLDEPSNHLDLEAMVWLEGFLDDYEGAFIVVSHDRYLLNRLAGSIAELERGRLTDYPGNYEAYLVAREEAEERQRKAADRQARERARVERFVERFRYKASKAKQVQARVKALAKEERIDAPEKRGRSVRFGFPPAPRAGKVVVRAEDVAKRYGDNVVYRHLDWEMIRGERLALVGPNGTGKSTLLKLIAGELQPDGGRIETGHNVAVGYYAQHQLEALEPEWTALEAVERVPSRFTRAELRSLLGRFLFRGADVDKKVGVLSGGERARLALSRLLLRPANLLLLDEPTNHLDLASREVLEDALNEYEGALVLVSHDRYFVNRVATSVGDVGVAALDVHPGDYDDWVAWKSAREAAEEAPAASTPERSDRREAKRREAEARNERSRRMRERERILGPLEERIGELEKRIGELEALQSDAGVYSQPERAAEVAREKAECESELDRLYGEWEAAAAED